MHEFTFEVHGWWNSPGSVYILSEEVLTTRLKKIINTSFLNAKTNTKIKQYISESEEHSLILPTLGEVNEEIFNASGYVHIFKSMTEDSRKCTLTIRKLEKRKDLK